MLPPELHESPDGEIRLVGHRITLYDVARRVRDGLSTELIQRELPTLDYAILNRVVEFIHDNPDLITTVIEEADREIKSQIASMQPVPSRAELRSRFDRIMARQSA